MKDENARAKRQSIHYIVGVLGVMVPGPILIVEYNRSFLFILREPQLFGVRVKQLYQYYSQVILPFDVANWRSSSKREKKRRSTSISQSLSGTHVTGYEAALVHECSGTTVQNTVSEGHCCCGYSNDQWKALQIKNYVLQPVQALVAMILFLM